MTAYYNEYDPKATAWLRELIKAGHIAPGDVDERSIEDVRPDELTGYTQCHFFAGIGTWSYALRQAGWPDDRPVWTGSPPCQPFSLAGQGKGYDDARHLAPKWLDLVKECRPAIVFGEQVASAFANKKHHWIDDLQDALEAEGYATGKIVLPACSIGSAHIRQRGWFVAERVGDPGGEGLAQQQCEQRASRESMESQEGEGIECTGAPVGGVADTQRDGRGCGGIGETGTTPARVQGADGERQRLRLDDGSGGGAMDGMRSTSSPHSRWSTADWLLCRDGKWRPVEPGLKPLVDGAPARVGRLRGYGNGIVARVAEEVIRAYMAT